MLKINHIFQLKKTSDPNIALRGNAFFLIFLSVIFFVIIFWNVFATWNVVQRWNLCIDLDNWKIVDWSFCWISTWDVQDNQTWTDFSWENNSSLITQTWDVNLNTWNVETGTLNTWNNIFTWNTVFSGSSISWQEITGSTENLWWNVDSWYNNFEEQTWNDEVWIIHQKTWIAFTWKDELQNAILRMYLNGLTKFNNKKDYMVDSPLTREQMAKMITQVYKVLWYPEPQNARSCIFSDINEVDPTLKDYVIKSCELWLLNWRDWKFHPHDTLTKAQALTIMIRLFEWKKSDESVNPWWKNYILKAQSIWLTKEKDFSKFDKPIPRWEVALLFYRFKSLAENSLVKQVVMQEMQNSVVWDSTSKKMNSETLNDALSLLTQWISAWEDPELREAVFWMYQHWMTEYDTADKFRAFDQIERQEAAKFIWAFHQQFINTWDEDIKIPARCYFKDLSDAKDELKPYILYDCAEWIFDWQDGRFHPTHSLTKAEFVASLIRMFGKKYTTTWNVVWRKPYFDQWLKLWLVNYVDRITFDKPITRYEVALILYRFRIKYQLLENLNSDNIENLIISMIQNSEKEIDWHKIWKVYITVTKLKDQDFSVWYIDLFGKRYKIVKRNIEKYFTNNFVRYWEVYDMVTDKPTWTLSLIVSNDTVLEWNIRPNLNSKIYYKISKPKETNAYYIISEQEW